MIRLSKPSISSIEMNNAMKVLKDEYLGMGPLTHEFERDLSEFFKREVVCVSSGTSALQIAMQAIQTKGSPKTEVLVPSLTFVGSYQAITAVGLKPISCDVDPITLNISLKDLSSKFNEKTLAIMPVHYCGDPTGIEAIYKFAKKNKIRVVEDAAHAFGSYTNRKLIGSFGDIACFSFDSIKNITCGEGGAIVTDDKKIIQRASDIRTLGVMGDTKRRYAKKRTWSFDIEEQGYRFHMTDLNASIGIKQLKRFPVFQKKRRKLAKLYDDKLSNIDSIELIKRNYEQITPHIYVIKLKDADSRDSLQDFLLQQGIQTGIHYFPNHQLTYFKRRGKLINTESIYPSLLTLPLHVDLTVKDIAYVAQAIRSYYASL